MIKVLFISSGRRGKPGDVVLNQGTSLEKAGIRIDYFLIKPGLSGYLSAVKRLRNEFKNGRYDLAHAHYSLCGYVAGIAGCKPLVVSLMGSDICVSAFSRKIISLFIRYRWNETIVKTDQMKELIGNNVVHVIPNGVDIEKFKPIPREIARQHIEYKKDKKLVVIIAGKNRTEKNIDLAVNAVKHLGDNNIDLNHIYNTSNEEIPYYLNAADVLLLTSKREGSVNVVKEAMACNCPVVATDVGDIGWVTANTEGCYITTFEKGNVAGKIKAALDFGKRTEGRQRIIELELDSDSVAGRIINLYRNLIASKSR